MGPPSPAIIDRLVELLGIESEYYDNWGRKHHTSPEAKAAILASMGVDVSEEELERRLSGRWLRLVEPALVVSVNRQPEAIPLHFPLSEGDEHGVTVSVSIEDESGKADSFEIHGVTAVESTVLNGRRYIKAEVPNRTDRALGYYNIRIALRTPATELGGSMRLIVTPDRCFEPQGRTWGVYANLYALSSGQNWGIGNLSDLGTLIAWVGSLGGDFVGINPLHAIPNRMPYGVSPYSSTSRLYRNFIYLDMEQISDDPEYRALISSPGFREEAGFLSGSEFIDYERVAKLKMRALRVAFDSFVEHDMIPGTRESDDFISYIEAEGRPLEAFATFSALEEHLRAENAGLYRWQDWPRKYRDPDSPAVREFKRLHEREVLFFKFVQWHIERQMDAAADEARKMGMGVGLYQDLAVGSSGGGSDAWSSQGVFAFGTHVGAPPDAFNLSGQNWGFPPLIPEKLKESGYEIFIQTIRSNLRHAGALRVDHVLGLFRLFWIPDGMSPREGTYIRYPSEDLLRIIALESVRNRAVIIGEDLGTIGDEVREALRSFGILSYRLFYFERDWSVSSLLPPEAYPEMALTAVTTHDLPTLYGYWMGRDIEVKESLDLYPDDESLERDVREREKDRRRILDAIGDCLPESLKRDIPNAMTPELSLCIHRHLGRTPCRMVVVNLDDIIGVLNQQNMPGTIDTHPNWRQKYPVALEDVFRNPHAKALADMFRQEGRGRG